MQGDTTGSRPKAVLATENRHKLREVAAMVAGAPFDLLSLADFPRVALPPETGETFEENAVAKAIAAADGTGLVAMGDDSGLVVDALGGRPGVYSARYAGPDATDAANLQLLLQEMKDIPDDRRQARFVCVIAIARPGGPPEVVRGVCEGVIARVPRGHNGFGYDPVFIIPEDGRTLAEFSPEEKNAISHRSRALAKAVAVVMQMVGPSGMVNG